MYWKELLKHYNAKSYEKLIGKRFWITQFKDNHGENKEDYINYESGEKHTLDDNIIIFKPFEIEITSLMMERFLFIPEESFLALKIVKHTENRYTHSEVPYLVQFYNTEDEAINAYNNAIIKYANENLIRKEM